MRRARVRAARLWRLVTVAGWSEALCTVVIVDDAAEVRLLVRTQLRLSGRFCGRRRGRDGVEAIDAAATPPTRDRPARRLDAADGRARGAARDLREVAPRHADRDVHRLRPRRVERAGPRTRRGGAHREVVAARASWPINWPRSECDRRRAARRDDRRAPGRPIAAGRARCSTNTSNASARCSKKPPSAWRR